MRRQPLYGSRAANGVILIMTKKSGQGTGFPLTCREVSQCGVDFRPTLNGDQRRELLYEGLGELRH